MKSNIKYLVNPVAGKRVALIQETSASKLAQLPQVAGTIGKTCLGELLRGKRTESKGWTIAEMPAPDRANKIGAEYIGTGKVRNRKPMHIYVSALPGRGVSERMHGDYRAFIQACQKLTHNGKRVEYNDLQREAFPTWTRNIISVYAARAKNEGFISIERESNKITKGN